MSDITIPRARCAYRIRLGPPGTEGGFAEGEETDLEL